MDKLENLSAVELGEKVNGQEIKPTEVIDYFARRIEERNPSINAFVYTKFDEAMEEAKKLEYKIVKQKEYGGLFAGVPFALKDFLPTKKGWTASHGGVKSLITVDEESGEFCKAMESLGGIAVGKTNAPSFGFRGTTYNKMYGNTHNPFNLKYNSGGSSGGSCAAVGSRMVPLAECGDAGGSTRCPSAWCNTFGFKPSAGLVPSVCRPDAWTATHPYCCGGPAARTVLDAAIVMEQMMRYDPSDPLSVPIPHKQFSELMKRDIQKMRIAVTHDYNIFPGVDSEIKDRIDHVATVLANAGACVDYVKFNFKHNLDDMVDAWLRGISIDTAIEAHLWKHKSNYDLIGEHSDELPPDFIKWTLEAFKSNMLDYRQFHEVRTDILDANLAVLNKYDIIISPVTSCMPVLNQEEDTKGPSEIAGSGCEQLIGFCQTWLQNMTGNPAASVPGGLGENNLPIGIQVIGKRYFDEDVFTVAYAIEQLLPWASYYERAK